MSDPIERLEKQLRLYPKNLNANQVPKVHVLALLRFVREVDGALQRIGCTCPVDTLVRNALATLRKELEG
jgi:hypothetical protein